MRLKLLTDCLNAVTLFSKAKIVFAIVYAKLSGTYFPIKVILELDNNRVAAYLRGHADDFNSLQAIWSGEYETDAVDPARIIDLGANIGLASMWFTLKFPHAAIQAYEPDPETFMWLDKNKTKRMAVYNMAAGVDGEVPFFKASSSLSSSTARPGNMTVPARSLDTIIGNSPVDILKMDIEGAEFDLVKNCTQLKLCDLIIGEFHTEYYNLGAFFELLRPTHYVTQTSDRCFVAVAR